MFSHKLCIILWGLDAVLGGFCRGGGEGALSCLLTGRHVWLSIAMILISSRVTSEIRGYIEYNYPTEHI